jgi:hypothetical protein
MFDRKRDANKRSEAVDTSTEPEPEPQGQQDSLGGQSGQLRRSPRLAELVEKRHPIKATGSSSLSEQETLDLVTRLCGGAVDIETDAYTGSQEYQATVIQAAFRNHKLKWLIGIYSHIEKLTGSELKALEERINVPLVDMRGRALLKALPKEIKDNIVAGMLLQAEYRKTFYEESDDWWWGYGFQYKPETGEYVIHISRGGDPNTPNGYHDISIKKIGEKLEYFDVYHADPRQHVRRSRQKLMSCPQGNYVSWQNEDYEPSGWREEERDFDFLLDDSEFQEYVYDDY